MAGMMATSASPRRNASAHCDGTVNERSYFPARGPSVKPQTSGAVFRNSTIETRNLAISDSQKRNANFQYSTKAIREGLREHTAADSKTRPARKSRVRTGLILI